MILDHWADVEADLAQWYGESDPLGLPWRRLRVLVNGLPWESRVMAIARTLTTQTDQPALPDWYRQLHPQVQPRRVMSDSDWIRQHEGGLH